MKIIIDIDKDYYKAICENGYIYDEDNEDIAKIIKDGTLLPKVHGDLIDRSKLLVELECGIRSGNYEEGYEKYPHINDMDDCFDTVKYADAVIKADKGDKE